MKKKIYIRKEINSKELRAPLVPSDVKKLIDLDYCVIVQSSPFRFFHDDEYENSGAIITNLEWYNEKFNDYLIIGIKELDNLDKLNSHTHLYFSHSYKNQNGSEQILIQFKNSKSKLYDFEYFLNQIDTRLISFGYYAGYVGGILGLAQYFLKLSNSNLDKLNPYKTTNNLLNIVNIKLLNEINTNYKIKVGLIGPKGKTGQGVCDVLKYFGIEYEPIYRQTSKNNLIYYDILYNCICLNPEQNEIWFDSNTKFKKNIIIVDISCDCTKPNNPIKIYSSPTNWDNPIYKPNEFTDIIAIDNLPSLLPSDSSIYFSNILINLLTNSEYTYSWEKNLNIFENKIKNI